MLMRWQSVGLISPNRGISSVRQVKHWETERFHVPRSHRSPEIENPASYSDLLQDTKTILDTAGIQSNAQNREKRIIPQKAMLDVGH